MVFTNRLYIGTLTENINSLKSSNYGNALDINQCKIYHLKRKQLHRLRLNSKKVTGFNEEKINTFPVHFFSPQFKSLYEVSSNGVCTGVNFDCETIIFTHFKYFYRFNGRCFVKCCAENCCDAKNSFPQIF